MPIQNRILEVKISKFLCSENNKGKQLIYANAYKAKKEGFNRS
jgi:hypothetical protein